MSGLASNINANRINANSAKINSLNVKTLTTGEDDSNAIDISLKLDDHENRLGDVEETLNVHFDLVSKNINDIAGLNGSVSEQGTKLDEHDTKLGEHDGRLDTAEETLNVHFGLVSNNINEINNLKNTVQGLNEPQLLLRKQVYNRNFGFGGGATIVLENLNTYISDYTNQRPFIGKITGAVHTTQRYSMGGFKADVCYIGGQNRLMPRVEYANMTTWKNAQFGLGEITLESEVRSTANQMTPDALFTDKHSVSDKNGTLTVNVDEGGYLGLNLRYNVYVSIFIQIETLLELQDLPTIEDPTLDALQEANGVPEDRRESRAILEDYVSPSLIEQTEQVAPMPLDIFEGSDFKVHFYARYKIDYLKNKILKGQYFKFLPIERWPVNSDIFLYQIMTPHANYYVSTFNELDKNNKNVIFNMYEDFGHNQSSEPFDRIITPYFHSGPVSNCLPSSIMSALVCAQTGLLTVHQCTLYRSGAPPDCFVYEKSLAAIEEWLWPTLNDLGLTDKDLHIMGNGQIAGTSLNLSKEFARRGINYVTQTIFGNSNLIINPEISNGLFNRTIGYNPITQESPSWNPTITTGGSFYTLIKENPNLTLEEYWRDVLNQDSFALCFQFGILCTYGFNEGVLSDFAINLLKNAYLNTEYFGATFGTYGFLITGNLFFDFTQFDMSATLNPVWVAENTGEPLGTPDSWKRVKMLDYAGKYAENTWINREVNGEYLKKIRVFATSTAKIGDTIEGVNYFTNPDEPFKEDSLELVREVYAENSEVLDPASLFYQDINYYNTSIAGYNPILLKFVEEVLGL